MGQLDSQTRIYVAEILRGFIEGDYDHVAEVHFQAGYVPKDQPFGDFKIACRAIGEPILGLPVNQISIAKLLTLLFKITEDFNMQTQPQLLLLQKTLVMVEGIAMKLYPEINMWKVTEPWVKDWAQQHLGSKAKWRDVSAELQKCFIEAPDILKKLRLLIEEKITHS